MKFADQDSVKPRDDIKGLRGLLFAMIVSVGMWAGMVGVVQSLLH